MKENLWKDEKAIGLLSVFPSTLKKLSTVLTFRVFKGILMFVHSTDKCFHTFRPLSATRVLQRRSAKKGSQNSPLKRPVVASAGQRNVSLVSIKPSPVVFSQTDVHYSANRLYKMSRATKVVQFILFLLDWLQIRCSVTIISFKSPAQAPGTA